MKTGLRTEFHNHEPTAAIALKTAAKAAPSHFATGTITVCQNTARAEKTGLRTEFHSHIAPVAIPFHTA